jgi:hypothetical protein
MDKYTAQFKCQPWHPLTDLPKSSAQSSVKADENKTDNSATKNHCNDTDNNHSTLPPITSGAKTLLYNIIFYLYLSVRERIKSLNFSGRSFESAKHELIASGLIIESNVGKKKYLMPKKEAFDYFSLICPYKNMDFIEHSFYLYLIELLFKKNKSYKSVYLEYKLTNSGNTADITAQSTNGSLLGFELTFSASNIIQNCLKYDNAAGFTKITFICRDSDILKAVKSKVLNAGLSLSLLSKFDFVLLSSILKD